MSDLSKETKLEREVENLRTILRGQDNEIERVREYKQLLRDCLVALENPDYTDRDAVVRRVQEALK